LAKAARWSAENENIALARHEEALAGLLVHQGSHNTPGNGLHCFSTKTRSNVMRLMN
jgi:hypothetical protein